MEDAATWFRANLPAGIINPIATGDAVNIDTNYIFRVDSFYPAKRAAVDYLDGVSNVRPPRQARITVALGGETNKRIEEYVVGPLPAGPSTTATRPVDFPAAGVHWNARIRDGPEQSRLRSGLVQDFFDVANEFLATDFGATYPEGIREFHTEPLGPTSADRIRRVRVMHKVPGTWRSIDLHQLPVAFVIDASNFNSNLWSITKIYWCDFEYATLTDLQTTLRQNAKGSPRRCAYPDPAAAIAALNYDAYPLRTGLPQRPFADRAGPDLYEPEGQRFRMQGRTVYWMDWEVTISGTMRNGPMLRNIKYKGERIAYELGIQDFLLVYSGNDVIHGNTAFMDASFGLGEWRGLLRGNDCPDTAAYLGQDWWGGGPVEVDDMVCVFEQWHPGQPQLWRRDQYQFSLKNYHLMIKFGTPAGNYDYITHFGFTLGGGIHVQSGSSGYAQTYWWRGAESRDPFGYRIQQNTFAPLHDHSIGFKVDLDILGEQNSVEQMRFRSGSTLDALNSGRAANNQLTINDVPSHFDNDEVRYIEYNTVQREQDARFRITPQDPHRWVIENQAMKNKWGNTRGYKIHIDAGDGMTYPNWVKSAAAFAQYNLQVSVQKDSEQTATGPYDNFQMFTPQGSLDNYFADNQSIVNQDLVQWITLHTLHAPTSEDYPLTVPFAASFWIVPHNYFDENPVMDMPADLIQRDGDIRGTREPKADGTCIPPSLSDAPHPFSGA
eukprot:TRINITY_DN67522_c8_g1_i1.p1 TRINITY_DN67522_c8_g1~~TRINITY_DN67522_c8_g1_i1.p1  ORF type:complete len:823 (+),score=110.86 TRINITY_DN67522_c8_g1_i1:307-2469(+)